MKIQFNQEELLNILYSALCNGGLIELSNCGVRLMNNSYSESYTKAKERLKHSGKTNICYEDVLIEILSYGGKLDFYESESDCRVSFDLDQARENLSNEQFADDMLSTHNGEDDAWTGFNLLQGALFGEVIYC